MNQKLVSIALLVGMAFLAGCSKPEVSATATGQNAVAIGQISGDVTINNAGGGSDTSSSSASAVPSKAPIKCGINNDTLTVTQNGVEKPVACVGAIAESGDVHASATGKNSVAIGVNKGDVKINRGE